MQRKPLIRLENVGYRLQESWIVRDVSLTLYEGQIMAIIGPNGAGKSTLSKLAAGLYTPDSGQRWLAPEIRLGYVPQSIELNQAVPMTVMRFLQLSSYACPESLDWAIAQTQLQDLLAKPFHGLSGGERQRALLARALLAKPQILILDEPTQGLDAHHERQFYQLLLELQAHLGMALWLVSHDLHFVMQGTDHVVCLNGHVQCQGAPMDLASHESMIALGVGEYLSVYPHRPQEEHVCSSS